MFLNTEIRSMPQRKQRNGSIVSVYSVGRSVSPCLKPGLFPQPLLKLRHAVATDEYVVTGAGEEVEFEFAG